MSKSISNPFAPFKIPHPLEPQILENLVQKLRDGTADKEDIELIYYSHMRYAIALVCRICPEHLVYDAIGEAMLALTEGLNRASTVLVNNQITPYLIKRVRGAIIDFIGDQYFVRARTYRRKKIKGPYMESLNPTHMGITHDYHANEVLESIEKCIQTDINLVRQEYKRAIVRLKAAGYSTVEISEMLSISIRQTNSLIQSIETRYIEMEKM